MLISALCVITTALECPITGAKKVQGSIASWGFGGQPLLLAGQTECANGSDVAIDRRSNPIPVVTSVNFDPQRTQLALQKLRAATIDDTQALADRNAALHLASLRLGRTVVQR